MADRRNHPGDRAGKPAHTPEEVAAANVLYTYAWSWSSTTDDDSYLNLALSDLGWVAVEAKVPKSGKPCQAGRCVTQDADVILLRKIDNYALMKLQQPHEKSDKQQLQEIGKRRPELQEDLAKHVAAQLPRIWGILVHADPKVRAARPSSSGPTALGKAEENGETESRSWRVPCFAALSGRPAPGCFGDRVAGSCEVNGLRVGASGVPHSPHYEARAARQPTRRHRPVWGPPRSRQNGARQPPDG